MKIISGFLFVLFIFITRLSFSQAPVVSFQHAYGGSSGESIYDLQKTFDGGIIMAGSAYSDDGDLTGNHGSNDYLVIKLDADRNVQWIKNYGGSGSDYAFSIRQTADGGYIAVGGSESDDGDVTGHHDPVYQRDCWVVKLDAEGNIIWQKSLGGSGTDIGHCVQQTTDGGYIIAAETFSFDGDVSNAIGSGDYWIVKLDASGNITWNKTYGGSSYDIPYEIQQTKMGGYIISGYSNSDDQDVSGHHGTTSTSDFWILKISSTGNKQWQHSFGGTGNDVSTSIVQTKDDGFLAGGSTSSVDGDVTGEHGGADVWLIKLGANGNMKWEHAYGGSKDDNAQHLEKLKDGGFIVSGNSNSKDGDVHSNHNSTDFWIFKINATGVQQWDNKYGGSDDDVAYATRVMPDGTYYTAGYTASYDEDAAGNHGETDGLLLNLGTVPLSNTISTDAITPEQICWEQPVTVDYTVTGTYNPGNIFTAQITDKFGSFVNETTIGSIASVNSGTINATIPGDLKPGSLFYIRVISSDPYLIGGAFPMNLKMKCDPPKGLKSLNISSSTAILKWNPGSCPLKYRVLWRPVSTFIWDTLEVTAISFTLTGLLPSTEYQWKVSELCSSSPELFSDNSKPAFFTTAPLKLSEEQNNSFNQVVVFPNPANSVINIRCSYNNSGTKNGTLVITDLLGKIAFAETEIETEISIDVSSFATGVYLVQLNTGAEIITTKFVRQ